MENSQILYKPFDINTHKANFINYLEIIITKDGKIVYAIPSHANKLECIYAMSKGLDPNDYQDKFDFWQAVKSFVSKACPRERYFDYMDWLCEETGAISVWGKPNSKIIGTPNDIQKEVIELLKTEDLY